MQVFNVWLLERQKKRRKTRDDFFNIWKLERKKNEEIKRIISRTSLVLFHIIQTIIHNIRTSRRPILFYTIQQVIPNICTKCQNRSHSSSREIFDTNFLMYYIGVGYGKKRKNGKKKDKINLSILIFCPTIYLATLKVCTKIENSGSHRSWEICHRKSDGRERKVFK